jgi:transcriptional regulator with XRE-family HTH domain
MNGSHYKRAIGARLIQAREALGLKQADLARGLDIPRDQLNRYERGSAFPDPCVIHRLWRLYGVTADWLYLGVLVGLPHSVAARLAEVDTAAPQGD